MIERFIVENTMSLMSLLSTIKFLILTSLQQVKMKLNQVHQQAELQQTEHRLVEMPQEGNFNFFFYKTKPFLTSKLFRLRRLVPTSDDWRMQCRELLQMIWNHGDSEPFRLPVDYEDHPGKK